MSISRIFRIKSFKFNKKALITIGLILAVLASTLVVFAREGYIKIFANSNPVALNINVTSLDTGRPVPDPSVPGAPYAIVDAAVSGSGMSGVPANPVAPGSYRIDYLQPNQYDISVSGLGGPNCIATLKNFNLSASNSVANIYVHTTNCDSTTPTPTTPTPNTPVPTPWPVYSPTPTATPSIFTLVIKGRIVGTNISSGVKDVTVVLGGVGVSTSVNTDVNGQYSFSVPNLTAPFQSSGYYLDINKLNYRTAYHNNRFYLYSVSVNPSQVQSGVYTDQIPDIQVVPDTTTFAVVGSVTDQNNALLTGVDIHLESCQTPNGGGPWSTTSIGAPITVDPSVVAVNADANYLFANILRPTDTLHQCLIVTASKAGYTVASYNSSTSSYYMVYTSGSSQLANVDIKLRDNNATATPSPTPSRTPTKTPTRTPSLTPTPSSTPVAAPRYTVVGRVTLDGSHYLAGLSLSYIRDGEALVAPEKAISTDPGTSTSSSVYNLALQLDPKGKNVTLLLDALPFGVLAPSHYSMQVNLASFVRQPDGNFLFMFTKDYQLSNYSVEVKVVDQSNSPVNDAKVRIYGDALNTSRQTDSAGKAVFYGQDIINYITNLNSIHLLESEVSKTGFLTSIQSISLNGQTIIIVLSPQIAQSQGEVKVNVVDTSNHKLAGAKVSMRLDSVSADPKTKNSNSHGVAEFLQDTDYNFGFASSSENLIFEVFKDGYNDGTSNKSHIILSVKKGNSYEITLMITRDLAISGNQGVRVLREGTLEGISQAKVEIATASPNTDYTDFSGITQNGFSLQEQRRYHIKVSADGEVTQERDVTIPVGYFDDDRTNVIDQFTFYFPEHSQTVKTVPIIVEDEVGSKISGAVVAVDVGGSDAKIIGETAAGGSITYATGFKYLCSLSDYYRDKTLCDQTLPDIKGVSSGQILNISAEANGYLPALNNSMVVITQQKNKPAYAEPIIIKLRKTSGYAVYVEVSNLPQLRDDQGNPKVILEEKQPNGSLKDTGIQPIEIPGKIASPDSDPSSTGTFVFLVPNDPRHSKHYYTAAIKPDIYSASAEMFNSTKDVYLSIDATSSACSKQGTYVKKYSIKGHSVSIVFENEKLYTDHKDLYDNKITQRINFMMTYAKVLDPLVITVSDLGQFNAFANVGMESCAKLGGGQSWTINFGSQVIDTFESENQEDLILRVISHEYSHLIQNMLTNSNGFPEAEWATIWHGIDNLPADQRTAIWAVFLDSNSALSQFGGHPWDNEYEMFASFSQAYFLSHGSLYGRIKYHLTAQEQNIVEFMWQIFSQRVGKINPDDNTLFTRRPLVKSNYTFAQIMNGNWIYR